MRRLLPACGLTFILILTTVHVSSQEPYSPVRKTTDRHLNSNNDNRITPVTQHLATDHLLISEFAVAPTLGEFIELYNGTDKDIDLHHYFLTDAISNNDNDYVNIVDSSFTPFGSDFLARFPDGLKLCSGDFLVIALNAEGFYQTYGFFPDVEIKSTSDQIDNMLPALPGAIGKSAGLSNAGECIILFYWDGETDLVSDVDYVVWGDMAEAMDKTNLQKDGPDPDHESSTYKNDTPILSQIPISPGEPHKTGSSATRINLIETPEIAVAGNGLTGHDETSENLKQAFLETQPTPGRSNDSDYIHVTFNCNACTWPDTLNEHGIIQLRGTVITEQGREHDDATSDTLSPGTILHWDAHSTISLINLDGDYWTGTFAIPQGLKLAYKFYVNAAHKTVRPDDSWEMQSLEVDLKSDEASLRGLRLLDLSSCSSPDTILPIQFLNGDPNEPLIQYQQPFTSHLNQIDLIFRVNMAGFDDFDPLHHTVGIRGYYIDAPYLPDDFNWDKTYPLTAEPASRNENLFYKGHIHIPQSLRDYSLLLKVVMSYTGHDPTEPWYLMPYVSTVDYMIDIPENDSTIHWKWFDNRCLVSAPFADTFIISVNADLNSAIENHGFDIGDSLWIRFGYYNSASRSDLTPLQRMENSTIFSVTDTIYANLGTPLYYQYFRQQNGLLYGESYYNFYDTMHPESRSVLLNGEQIDINDVQHELISPHRTPCFLNHDLISGDSMTVLVQCDIRPAIYQLLKGDTLCDSGNRSKIVSPIEIFDRGVVINGPICGVELSPSSWDTQLVNSFYHRMYDDGSHFDSVANDSIFTTYFTIYSDSLYRKHGPPNRIGHKFKFGIAGLDNESHLNRMHVANLDVDSNPSVLRCQFGSIDPLRFDAWDYDHGSPIYTDIRDSYFERRTRHYLFQNYPNPVNSFTSIAYELTSTSHVSLKIYNLVGQEVKTLVDEEKFPGQYAEKWNGKDLFEKSVTSGIYLYRLKTNQCTSIKKMLVIK
ncbi:T9SS type A sorting domain-containing protein [candidate division KSB1 bacterium]|nr:T9SS type A sorting domain-containing protein [candidate division KSB1 bacterium]